MKIVPIGAPLLPKVWQHVAPLLNKAVRLSPELIRINDVYDAALQGVYLFWVALDEDSGEFVGVISTRIIDYNCDKISPRPFTNYMPGKSTIQPECQRVRERQVIHP